jgi:acyl carrier protein
MNDQEVLTKIQQAFKSSFDVDPEVITVNTTANDVSAWDSVGHLTLAGNLEEIFGVTLDVDELMEMESVREIARIVSGKLAAKA